MVDASPREVRYEGVLESLDLEVVQTETREAAVLAAALAGAREAILEAALEVAFPEEEEEEEAVVVV